MRSLEEGRLAPRYLGNKDDGGNSLDRAVLDGALVASTAGLDAEHDAPVVAEAGGGDGGGGTRAAGAAGGL